MGTEMEIGTKVKVDMGRGIPAFLGVVAGIYYDWAGVAWYQIEFVNGNGVTVTDDIRQDFVTAA